VSGRDDDWLLGQIEQTHRIMGIEIGVSGASECGGGWERAGVGECVHRPATISSVSMWGDPIGDRVGRNWS